MGAVGDFLGCIQTARFQKLVRRGKADAFGLFERAHWQRRLRGHKHAAALHVELSVHPPAAPIHLHESLAIAPHLLVAKPVARRRQQYPHHIAAVKPVGREHPTQPLPRIGQRLLKGVPDAMAGVVEVNAREERDPIRYLSGQRGPHPFV